MTVGKTHDIKGGAAAELKKLGAGGNRLYFVLPPLYSKDFTKKTPQSIDQWALRIPYPEFCDFDDIDLEKGIPIRQPDQHTGERGSRAMGDRAGLRSQDLSARKSKP